MCATPVPRVLRSGYAFHGVFSSRTRWVTRMMVRPGDGRKAESLVSKWPHGRKPPAKQEQLLTGT